MTRPWVPRVARPWPALLVPVRVLGLALGLALVLMLMQTGCTRTVSTEGVDMTKRDDRLVGAWQRSSGGACAAGYAARLRIEPGGLYFGETDPPGAFTWWDGGTWQVPETGRLSLSTANDAVVSYGYRVEGDTLTITDAKDCTFSFRRTA